MFSLLAWFSWTTRKYTAVIFTLLQDVLEVRNWCGYMQHHATWSVTCGFSPGSRCFGGGVSLSPRSADHGGVLHLWVLVNSNPTVVRKKTNDLHPRKQTWEIVSPFQRGYVQVPCLFSGVYWIWGTTGQKSVFVFYISHEFPMNIQIFSGSKQRRFFKWCFPFEILKTFWGGKTLGFSFIENPC